MKNSTVEVLIGNNKYPDDVSVAISEAIAKRHDRDAVDQIAGILSAFTHDEALAILDIAGAELRFESARKRKAFSGMSFNVGKPL